MENIYKEDFTVEVIRDDKTNKVIFQHWTDSDGDLRNPFGPYTTEYDRITGEKISEHFNQRLDENGQALPNIIDYDPVTKNIIRKVYTNFKSARHRELWQGHAEISYDPVTEEITDQSYWLHGNEVDELGNIIDNPMNYDY